MNDSLLIAILSVLAIACATAIAPKLRVAGPLVLVIVGLGVSLLPFVPAVEVAPEIILVGVLPPLLYSAAVNLPAIEFRRDFGPIAGLSVVLVVLTSIALGFFFAWLVPGLGLPLGIALGAILSPTDAVATSIIKRLGLSRRVVTMLEGESLLNDATSLVLLRTMIATAAVGVVPRVGDLIGTFVWGVLIAVVVGAVVGWLNLRLRGLVSNSAANTAIGFIVPFVAYLPTEHLGGSGLVAAVTAGIVTGQGAARRFTPEQRMSDTSNWRTIELVLEGAVFLIMGLELRKTVEGVTGDRSIFDALVLALGALLIIIVVRALYVTVIVAAQDRRARDKLQRRERLTALSDRIDGIEARAGGDGPPLPASLSEGRGRRRIAAMRARVTSALADLDYYQASPMGWKHGAVIVWAGMRGVVTLAAAQTLPRETTDRPLLVLVAFMVAVGSLVLQGLSAPWLVKILGIKSTGDEEIGRDEQSRLDDELRRAAASALTGPLTKRDGSAFPRSLIDLVGDRFVQPPEEDPAVAMSELYELRLALIEVMRERLIELSSGGTYRTPTLKHALAELDADQLSLELRLKDG